MMPRMNLNGSEARNEGHRNSGAGGLKRDKSHTNYQKRAAQLASGGLEIIAEEFRQNPLVKRRTSVEMSKDGTKRRSMLIKNKQEKVKKTCRICLCEQEEKAITKDPIISACHCKGSSGDIHLKCLQVWLN